MPYVIQHGSARGLLGAAKAAGRAEARQRREEREFHVSMAVEAAARQKDVVQLRAKARGLQDAAALRSERFRTEELGIRKRGMALTERREARVAKAAVEKQALITQGTAKAIDLLGQEFAEGLIDKEAFETRKIALYTGNMAAYTASIRSHTRRRTEDEKQRAKVLVDFRKRMVIVQNPQASNVQRERAAKYLLGVQEKADERWGTDWQDQPFEFFSADLAATLQPDREAQRIEVTPWPYDIGDLLQGKVYALPSKGGQLHTYKGPEKGFQIIGVPRAKK